MLYTRLFDQLIAQQQQLLLKVAREIVPCATEDDVLQPYDFPMLELDPRFRYEEGVLHGLQAAKAAWCAEVNVSF